jgi:ribokinase
MDIVLVGSLALDTIQTPHGSAQDVLGGSAVFASLAASRFAQCGIVGVIGEDFPQTACDLFDKQAVDLSGLERSSGKTFRWSGYYEGEMDTAHTRETQLNVFADFKPVIPEVYKSARLLFLANIDPELQASVLGNFSDKTFFVLDTMNYWIANKRDALIQVMRRVNLTVLNEGEAKMLSGQTRLMHAADWIRKHINQGLLIKKGEHGALLFWEDQIYHVPAIPLRGVVDPTGAGDSFAGGFIGALAQKQTFHAEDFRRGLYAGTVMASFAVENFSVEGIVQARPEDILQRYQYLMKLAASPRNTLSCRNVSPTAPKGNSREGVAR